MVAQLPAPLYADYPFNGINQSIPDGLGTGLTDVRLVENSPITSIQSISVSLNITGDFNGDLYGYLMHGSSLAILLNRPGKTSLNPYGYADSGLSVTLSDTASFDLHLYQDHVTLPAGTQLTGTWQPDGRSVDPGVVLDTSARSAFLQQFAGANANGDWTLFLADLHSGGQSLLVAWELQLTGVPEPGETLGIVAVATLIFAAWQRRRPKD